MAALLCTAIGCEGSQSALNPQGPQAGRIATLSWIIFGFGAAILAAVTVLFLNAVRRPPASEPRLTERQAWKFVIIAGVAIPSVILFAFLAYSVHISNVTMSPPENPLTIEVFGRKWWWDFRYRGETASDSVRVSNEIHIPVGRPIQFELRSLDVIHSFWVPNLHGKMDLIPGRTNTLSLQADNPGVFRGQCAEYCGLQHAHMAFIVVAEPEEEFQAWLAHQRSPASDPADPALRHGQEVFLTSSCGLCHAVRGTTALARVGPDLTHISSRRTLGAGTIPNTRGHLGGWIADPQSIKPGSFMPPNQVPAEDLMALIGYLESLK